MNRYGLNNLSGEEDTAMANRLSETIPATLEASFNALRDIITNSTKADEVCAAVQTFLSVLAVVSQLQ